MTTESGNLRAALEYSLTTPGAAEQGLRLVATLWFHWVGSGRFAEGRHWLDRALSLETEPSRARCRALWVTGYIATLQGDTSAVPTLVEACRTEAAQLGDVDADSFAVYVRGAAAVSDDAAARRGAAGRSRPEAPGAGAPGQQRDHGTGDAGDHAGVRGEP